MRGVRSLRVGGVMLVVIAFALGLLASGIWFQSNARWDAHLDRAKFAGALLYDTLQAGSEPPHNVSVVALSQKDQMLANDGRFEVLSSAPQPALVTNLSIRSNDTFEITSELLNLAILSPDLRYPLASVSVRPDQPPGETLAALTQLMASYCSEPVMIAKAVDTPWVIVNGSTIWSCSAAPGDYRLLAAFLAFVSISILVTLVLNSSAQFSEFAQMLRARNRIGGPSAYDTDGLMELRDIVSAVNDYLAIERDRLADRVAVLSGVSHDLGTPATRLRLRTALIQDEELRTKLNSDIDSMTGIIESVLTYTQAELDAEAPRRISLTSLIEAIAADYQDVGSPVEFHGSGRTSVQGAQSLFMSRRGIGSFREDDKVIVMARPVALGRAVSNLIDNALKYGRRAKIGLEKNADSAIITVEDEGTQVTAQDIEELMAPFKRGSNTKMIRGSGLGLTIVSTIANMHGGTLTFEPGTNGLIAKITIQRR